MQGAVPSLSRRKRGRPGRWTSQLLVDNNVVIMEMNSGDSVVVAVGEYGGIHVNDKPMRDDHRVIAFIDKYVYGPHEQDEDYWWPEDIRRIHAYTRRFFEQLDKESQTE